MLYLNYDGDLIIAGQPLIKSDNRGLRYGDGLFETMKMKDGYIDLWNSHIERLFNGINLMAFDLPSYFTPEYLRQQIETLCISNGHNAGARIRLMIIRGEGNLYDPDGHTLHYIIETSPLLPTVGTLNIDGYITGLYKDARKQIDSFSNLKTNNYLTYSMGAIYAKKHGWNDCLITNSNGAICESTIASVFIIKDGIIITPSLDQGCVAGVMRKHLLSVLPDYGYQVREEVLSADDMINADEVFLTNAIQGIKWVKQFEHKFYKNDQITSICNALNR